MKAIAARADTRDLDDLRLLKSSLASSSAGQAHELVAIYYGRKRVSAKTQFEIEEPFYLVSLYSVRQTKYGTNEINDDRCFIGAPPVRRN